MSIPNRTLESTAAEHLADHLALHKRYDGFTIGPFTLAHGTSGIDTGVTLWTPEVGDRIIGVSVEFSTMFNVTNEQIGLGIAGTTDADLGFLFPVTGSLPSDKPTWVRGQGLGVPFGGEVARIITSAPIVARTVIGGNSAGSLSLWVHTIA